MISDGDMSIWPAHRAVFGDQAGESLRARNLLDQMTVDVKERVSIVVGPDDVLSPDLVVKRLPGHGMRRVLPVVRLRRRKAWAIETRGNPIPIEILGLRVLRQANYANLHAYSIGARFWF
jgi:hypothetical protein